MKQSILSATDIIELSNQLEAASYKTLDMFFCKIWGIDYDKVPYYQEAKSALDHMMECVEVKYPTYTSYEWICK
ncbi:hypothetical protein [Brevibacillus sp. NRS-1366]|uniref:hypothetical protein n=1 Tax=Brevibacillus sp. NRS-1366 TaxID=3233899 RepID=UPI003D25E2AE